jgi:hypothetical protein
VADVRVGLQPADGTGQHHRPAAAALDQVRDRGLGAQPHAGQVDVDHVLPEFLLHLVQRVAGVPDAGVGHDDVQPAQLRHPVVNRRLQRVVVAHVGLRGDDAPVQRLDLLDGLRQVLGRRHRERDALELLADVHGDDVRALLRQPHRVAAALAASRPRDEGDLACHSPWHRYLFS